MRPPTVVASLIRMGGLALSIPLIAIVTAIYFGVAWSEYRAGRHGMAFTWVAYAFANIGMIWNIMQQTSRT